MHGVSVSEIEGLAPKDLVNSDENAQRQSATTRYIIIDGTPINFSMQSRPERYFISRQYVHIRVYRSRKRATTTPVDVYARHVYAKNWRPLLYTLLSSTRGLSPFSAGPQTVDNVATFDTVHTVPIVDYRIIWRRNVQRETRPVHYVRITDFVLAKRCGRPSRPETDTERPPRYLRRRWSTYLSLVHIIVLDCYRSFFRRVTRFRNCFVRPEHEQYRRVFNKEIQS